MSSVGPAEVLSWILPKCRRCKEHHPKGPCPSPEAQASAPEPAVAPASTVPVTPVLPLREPSLPDREANLVRFTFDGDALEVVPGHAEAHVVIRRVCEALGVDFGGQLRSLKSNPAATVDFKSTVGADGKRRKIACLDLRSLPLWLAGIHPNKVRPAIRPKLIRYQRECADVLADHFFGKRGGAKSALSEALVAELAALRAEVAALRGLSVEVARLRERIDASDEAAERRRFVSSAPTLPAGDGQPLAPSPSKPQSQRRQLQGARRRAMRGLSPSASDADAKTALDDFNARVAQVYRRAAAIDRALLDRTPLPLFPDPAPWGLPFLPVVRVPIDRAHHRLHAVEVAFRNAVPLCVAPPDALPPHGPLMRSMGRELGSLTFRVEVLERNFLKRSGLTATTALDPAPPAEPDPAPAAPWKPPLAPLTSKEMAAVAAEADVGTHVVLRRLKGFSTRVGTRERVDRALRLLGYADHIPAEELPATAS